MYKSFPIKSRVESAIVLEIVDDENNTYQEAFSFVHKEKKGLVYKVGEIVQGDGFDDNLNNQCGKGISVHKYKDQCLFWFPKANSVK